MPASDREPRPRRRTRRRPEFLALERRWLLSASGAGDGDLPDLPATLNPPALTSVISRPGAGAGAGSDAAVDPTGPVVSSSPGTVSLVPAATTQVVRVGQTVTNQVTGTATRAGQGLTYTLEPSDPELSILDTRSGDYSWTPTADMLGPGGAPKTYRIAIRATENSPEAPFAVATFTVRVLPAGTSDTALAAATAEANGGTAVDPETGALVAEAQAQAPVPVPVRSRAEIRRAAAAEKKARAVLQLARRVPNPQVQARLLRRAARLSARAAALA